MNFKLLITLSSILLVSCKSSDKPVYNRTFKIPIVINSSSLDTLKLVNHQSLRLDFIPIVGKCSFGDTIDLNGRAWTDNFEDYVKFDTQDWIENDSLDVNGFELFLDYNQTVLYGASDSYLLKYYPVFLVNSSSSSKIFTGRDFAAIGVQQARFGDNEWRRIQEKGEEFNFCGNGYMYIIVKPGEFIILLIRKYYGEFHPHIRVAIKNGQSIIVSKSFIGDINEDQYNTLKISSKNNFDVDSEVFQF